MRYDILGKPGYTFALVSIYVRTAGILLLLMLLSLAYVLLTIIIIGFWIVSDYHNAFNTYCQEDFFWLSILPNIRFNFLNPACLAVHASKQHPYQAIHACIILESAKH